MKKKKNKVGNVLSEISMRVEVSARYVAAKLRQPYLLCTSPILTVLSALALHFICSHHTH